MPLSLSGSMTSDETNSAFAGTVHLRRLLSAATALIRGPMPKIRKAMTAAISVNMIKSYEYNADEEYKTRKKYKERCYCTYHSKAIYTVQDHVPYLIILFCSCFFFVIEQIICLCPWQNWYYHSFHLNAAAPDACCPPISGSFPSCPVFFT